MPAYHNILVVRTDRIGDVLLTTPALAALRGAYPRAKIVMMIAPETYDIVGGNPCLDEIIVDDRKESHRGFFGFLKLVSMARKRKFDLAVVFHTKKRTNLACFLAGIPNRVGYRNDKFGFLLTDGLYDSRPEGAKHESEYCLDVLWHLGIAADGLAVHMPLKSQSEDWAKTFLKDNNIAASDTLIAVHPGASCVSKRWPAGSFAQLIDAIMTKKNSARVIMVGGPETKSIAGDVLSSVKSHVIDLTGELSLTQLASLLKRCHVLVSNDSGPVHIAAAVGTPVVSIFGRNQAGLSPVRWRPLGKKDMVLHKEVGCEICLAHNCVIDFECLKAITPQEVLEAVQSIL